jgi:hypothetical protein
MHRGATRETMHTLAQDAEEPAESASKFTPKDSALVQ